jgi:hypothetical protein
MNNDDTGYASMRRLSYYVIGGCLISVIVSGIASYYLLR